MEPAREERDDKKTPVVKAPKVDLPQWSPLVKSGMTSLDPGFKVCLDWPQWSPLVKSGMTGGGKLPGAVRVPVPQWSPLVKSGMTRRAAPPCPRSAPASRNGARS